MAIDRRDGLARDNDIKINPGAGNYPREKENDYCREAPGSAALNPNLLGM